MNVVCPHCKAHRIVGSKVPKDVVVVMPCPSCGELVVMFRRKVVALDRHVLDHGTKEQKTTHLATVIAEFIEPGMFRLPQFLKPGASEAQGDMDAAGDGDAMPPITDTEVAEFSRVQLQRLDDPKYFKKYFGA